MVEDRFAGASLAKQGIIINDIARGIDHRTVGRTDPEIDAVERTLDENLTHDYKWHCW